MKIKNIVKTPFKGTVYDIGCSPDHVFFANGLLVHNCYKGNSNTPAENMTFDTFKNILDKMPKTLTQIAFGITGVQTNPDFFRMMEYSREKGVVPNFTLSGIDITDEIADKIAATCGAVAVSVYQSDKNVGYNTIKMLTDRGMTQVNIHAMVSEETLDFVKEIVMDKIRDPRLAKMNCIVFLGVKPKGRAKGSFHPLSFEKFANLAVGCMAMGVRIGFDSCSAPKFANVVKKMKISEDEKQALLNVVESCESTLFSSYINQKGDFYPCSFCEGENEWTEGVSVLGHDNFSDVWRHSRVEEWRKKLLCSVRGCDGCRQCIAFPEINV